jgi:hypothetical protein
MDLTYEQEFDLFINLKKKYFIVSEDRVIQEIRNFTYKYEITKYSETINLWRKFLTFLIVNKYYLNNNKEFKDFIKERIIFLYNNNKWINVSLYYYYLYNKPFNKKKKISFNYLIIDEFDKL